MVRPVDVAGAAGIAGAAEAEGVVAGPAAPGGRFIGPAIFVWMASIAAWRCLIVASQPSVLPE
jgi:hypothetical protein